MKKLFISICFILFWCNLTFAERVTLGFAGDSCKQFNDSRKDFGKELAKESKAAGSARASIGTMMTGNHAGSVEQCG